MLLYMALTRLRKQKIDMRCVDTIAMYMFYIFIIDFSLEMLDLIHRIYEADESFNSLNFMVTPSSTSRRSSSRYAWARSCRCSAVLTQ